MCILKQLYNQVRGLLAKSELSFSPVYKHSRAFVVCPSLAMLIEAEMLEIPWYNVKEIIQRLREVGMLGYIFSGELHTHLLAVLLEQLEDARFTKCLEKTPRP